LILRPIRDIPSPPPAEFGQRAFLSLLKHGVAYIGAYREFTPGRSDRETSVRIQFYDSEFGVNGQSSRLLLYGEDPRIFTWRDRILISAIAWRGKDWEQIIADVFSEKTHTLQHRLAFAGKNWAPVIDQGSDRRLLFIRSLQPLCILEADDRFRCHPIIAPSIVADNIGEYRCAGPAKLCKNIITGYGHRTQIHPDRHTPFHYKIDLTTQSVEFQDLTPQGFAGTPLIDPTSEIDGRLVCACSAAHWWIEQPIIHQLCEIV